MIVVQFIWAYVGLCFLAVPGRFHFHRSFPLLSQPLAAAILHTTNKDYSLSGHRWFAAIEGSGSLPTGWAVMVQQNKKKKKKKEEKACC